jgi:NADP-dependent 3-hydroxy acid dehydrogenase YdfG
LATGSFANKLSLEVIQLDVSDEAHATTVIDQALEKFGRIDVVMNSAGYSLLL